MTIKQIQEAIFDGLASGKFTRAEVQKISDGIHTFVDVYDRAAHWNALALVLMESQWGDLQDVIGVAKSRIHHDGSSCPPGTFIVGALTHVGQMTQHYELKHWDMFNISEHRRFPWKFDGHTKKDVQERIRKLIVNIDASALSVKPVTHIPLQGKTATSHIKDLMDHGYLVEPPQKP